MNIEFYFNNNDIINFKRELENFIKYIIKKHYKNVKFYKYKNDLLNDTFLFVLDKLKDNNYKFKTEKGNFRSYVYTLIRWYLTSVVYNLKKENNFFINNMENYYEFFMKRDYNNLSDKINDIIKKYDINNVDLSVIYDFLFNYDKRKINLLKESEKSYIKLIIWVLKKEIICI